jgi:glycosyltransferase involved in cell wall biosynthesis
LRKVLIISYYWPPSGGPGVQRILKFAKYLPKYGWEPIILTVKNGEYPSTDLSLKAELDTLNIKVYESFALEPFRIFKWISNTKELPTYQLNKQSKEGLIVRVSNWVRLNLFLPDARIGWIPFARKMAEKIIKTHGVEVVFTSGPPHSSHFIASKLKKKMNIKWLGDFRDPWTEFFNYHDSSRTQIARNLDKKLEGKILNKVDHLVTVSPSISRLFSQHIGNSKNVTTIMNGFDEDDFSDVQNSKQNGKDIIISYVGNMAKSQDPIEFLELIQNLNTENNFNIRVNFVGNIHSDILGKIESLGYAKFINRISYVSHSEAIKYMCEADYVLLLIPNVPNNKGIVTGKIFEYIRSGSTILMLGPKDSDAGNIIKQSESGFVFNYGNIDGLKSIFNERKTRNVKNNSQFSREWASKKLANVFNEMINHVP